MGVGLHVEFLVSVDLRGVLASAELAGPRIVELDVHEVLVKTGKVDFVAEYVDPDSFLRV